MTIEATSLLMAKSLFETGILPLGNPKGQLPWRSGSQLPWTSTAKKQYTFGGNFTTCAEGQDS